MGINVKSILRGAATIAAPLVSATPWGAAALAAVNAFLPDDEKLPEKATGAEVLAKVESLPPDQQAALLGQMIEADMNESDNFAANVQAMAEVDKVGGSTRPQIALLMARYVVTVGALMLVALCIAVWKGEKELAALGGIWPLAFALLTPPIAIVRAYFGLRTKEKNARYAAGTGQPVPELKDGIAGLFSRVKSVF